MQLQWDYSLLAKSYVKRPPYAPSAIEQLFQLTGIKNTHGPVADIGAGTAHLTLELAQLNLPITAVEPNDQMREIGVERTSHLPHVRWKKAMAEETGLEKKHFALVTFGSSFNVTDRQQTLLETNRILRPEGWFACMWNHRDLNDPIQKEIENIIGQHIPNYDYGSRRENQQQVIEQSRLFNQVHYVEGDILHTLPVEDAIEAWSSHGTLQRQAQDKFADIVQEISAFLLAQTSAERVIQIPYKTRMWVAQKRSLQ